MVALIRHVNRSDKEMPGTQRQSDQQFEEAKKYDKNSTRLYLLLDQGPADEGVRRRHATAWIGKSLSRDIKALRSTQV